MGKQQIQNVCAKCKAVEDDAHRHLKMAQATARIAIDHLQKTLDATQTPEDRQAARRVALDWLQSIGCDG